MNFAALSLVRHGAPRRGMLLLLVLSMLSLFMVMGALGIVLSTRARESARAFAEASASQVGSPALARAQLDEALMLLLRGSPDDATPVAGGTRLPESLLADRYGNETIVGTLTEDIVVEPGTPLLKAFMSGVQTQNPIELNGRVVTFVPPSGGAGAAVSYRIARVEIPPPSAVNPNPTFWLSHVRTFVPGPAMNPVRPADPPRFPVKGWKVLINGRDFSGRPGSPNESYDAFDEQNEFLTALELRNSRVHGVKRPAFGQRNQQATVDNDNDGVSDGIWIEGLLPEQSSLGGGTLTFDVSYLVLDLDGRINLNAHGSMSVLQDDPGKYPHKVPLGMGFGPADVDATLVVPGRDPNKPFETWGMLLGGGRPRPVSTVSSTNQWRPPALVTQNVDGRYGPHLQPGDPGVDLMPAGIVPEMFAENWLRPRRPPGEALTSIDAGASWMYTAQENTPDMINPVTDLKVRTQVFTTNVASGVPAMRYFRPPSPGVRPIPPPPPWRNEEADLDNDPYEMRIDIDLGRQSKLGSAAAADNVGGDALFSIAELERVLRQYDNDAATLPPRLAVILDDLAERSRMTVTTDSWDTPGLVGEAAHKVEDYAVALPKTVIYDVLSPDITAGLRFNVNRPILQKTVSVEATTEKEAMTKAEDTDRERYDWMALFAIRGNGNAWNVTMDNRWAYFRHLYTLAVALGSPHGEETAQWVANVVEFRDTDSTMSWYPYDTQLSDGWNPPRAQGVAGAERPEVVITETLGYESTGFVVLHRAWRAELVDGTSGITAAEMIDPNLAPVVAQRTRAQDRNALDLRRRDAGNEGSRSMWRLRLDNGREFAFGTALAQNDSTQDCKMLPDSFLSIGTAASGLPSVVTSALNPRGPGDPPQIARTVKLERLMDPSRAYDSDRNSAGYNDYIVVDEAPINYAERQADARVSARCNLAPTAARVIVGKALWCPEWNLESRQQVSGALGMDRWFHWPNRDFVSHAELMCVPTGGAAAMLSRLNVNAAQPSVVSLTVARPLLLDATIVPSRFRDADITVPNREQSLATIGMRNFPYGQVSRWREAGRINVNTLLPNVENSPNVGLDNAVIRALLKNNGTQPFLAPGMTPPQTIAQLVTHAGVYPDSVDPLPPTQLDQRKTSDRASTGLECATAIRLGNVATVRSNVFAVWITLRITDSSANAGSPECHRLFALVDRSIPVGHQGGVDHNVRDMVRIRRILE